MKLLKKLFLISGLITLMLVTLGNLNIIRFSFTYYNLMLIFAGVLIFASVYYFIVRRILSLNHILSQADVNNEAERIDVTGSDEITQISQKINEMFDFISESKQQSQNLTETLSMELQKSNLLLHQEQTQRVLAEKKLDRSKQYLSQRSKYDSLTALPNGVFFNEILNKAISHARRHQKILAVLMIDIDNFDHFRTKISPENARILIKEMSTRLAKTLRSEDILAKLDEDEFIILLNDIAKAKFAATVADKLQAAIARPIVLDGNDYHLTISIGISLYPTDGDSIEDLLNHADNALYKAKQHGNNQYEFFTTELSIEAHEHIKLGAALKQAIANRELTLYFQPKYNLKKGTISGVETLIRWEHPQLGLLAPAHFMPAVEETGLMIEVGNWILLEACKTNKYWQDEGYEHLTTSVNLSAKQFHHPDIALMIKNALDESGLNPQYLEIEITENIVMADAQLANSILNNIKSTGVHISIDHFGTGYTAISYLKLFPLTAIKLDQIFIKGIPANPNDMAITNAVIALAHSLGLEVVAEGVETAEQVQYLGKQNCDMVQGYFLGHPLPAKKLLQQFKNLRDEVLF